MISPSFVDDVVVAIIAVVRNRPSIYFIVGLSSPLPGMEKGHFPG
jgi:hypothetical protein